MLSKAFSLAIRWGWRTDNPCKGVQHNVEHNRERYLEADELARFADPCGYMPKEGEAFRAPKDAGISYLLRKWGYRPHCCPHPRASLELFALAKHSMLEPLALARSMSGLKGKVAVATGASKGIGAAIAKELSAAGALVIRSAALEPRGYAETREAARAAFAKSWRRA